MRYKLLLLDIDGTLRPGSCEQIPKENAAAVRAVQKAGVKIAIATGRGRTGVGKGLLRDLKPDYWVCAGGAQLVDAKGNDLALHRLTAEEMYALVDFFEDYELPLRFTFHDANYAYIDFAEFDRREKAKNLYNNIVDGEDQDHHLVEMPFGCFGFLPREQAAQFQEKYGYLGLQFLYSYPGSDGCDIMQKGVNKGAGLCELAGLAGLTPEECVAIGDGDNDTAMLAAAGMGIAMANGSANAKAAADRCESLHEADMPLAEKMQAAQKVTTDFVLEDSFLITNVGRFALPESCRPYVLDYGAILPCAVQPFALLISSYGDKMKLSVAQRDHDMQVVEDLCAGLRQLGIQPETLSYPFVVTRYNGLECGM